MNSEEVRTPSVAVIVPVYNVAPYLSDCLDAILNQEYKNFTVFTIDDGSTDNSGKILDKYANKSSKIIAIHQKNKGVSATRNFALELVIETNTFDYIAFVDSDDKIQANFLSSLVNNAVSHQADITVCGYYEFNNVGQTRIKGKIRAAGTLDQEEFVEFIFSVNRWNDHSGSGGMPPMKLFSTKTLTNVRFPTDRSLVEDELFCLQACLNAKKIYFFSDRLYGYRQHFESAVKDPAFFVKQLYGREVCLKIAEQISHRAATIVASSLASTIVYLCIDTNFNTQPFLEKYKSIVLESAENEYIPRKILKRYLLFCNYSVLSKAFLALRNTFRNLQFWKKKHTFTK